MLCSGFQLLLAREGLVIVDDQDRHLELGPIQSNVEPDAIYNFRRRNGHWISQASHRPPCASGVRRVRFQHGARFDVMSRPRLGISCVP